MSKKDIMIRGEGGKFDGAQPNAITVETATEMQARGIKARHENAVKSAMIALGNGETGESIESKAYGGWTTVCEAQKRLALTPSKGTASTNAATFLGKATGMLSQQREAVEGLSLTMDQQTAAEVLRLLAER